MDLNEVRTLSKDKIGPYCKACPACDGKACSNKSLDQVPKAMAKWRLKIMTPGRKLN